MVRISSTTILSDTKGVLGKGLHSSLIMGTRRFSTSPEMFLNSRVILHAKLGGHVLRSADRLFRLVAKP